MKCLLLLLLVYTGISFCKDSKFNYEFKITQSDKFPHNIDQDFVINIHHPDLEYHHFYATYILKVDNKLFNEIQTHYIYPGYLPKLDRRLKETYFHIMNFNTYRFNTQIIVRFYREANNAKFTIDYSPKGAKNLHIQPLTDSLRIYQENIYLFRPPILKLVIQTEDGHKWGLSINIRSIITCTSQDGLPPKLIKISTVKPLNIVKKDIDNEDKVEIIFSPQLTDHLNSVTCASGLSSVTKQIKVFHRSESVEIIPSGLSHVLQNSSLQCKGYGEGYPASTVKWSVANLNKTSEKYFTISSSKMISVLTVNSIAPNNTQWQLKCSAMNIIPPLHHSGPFKLINITIGENIEASKLAAARIWTVSIVIIVLIVLFLFGLLCIGSKVKCKSRKRSGTPFESVHKSEHLHLKVNELAEKEEPYFTDKSDDVV